MNAPYVCLRCSRQLVRSKCQRRSSDFVSLGQLVGRDDDTRTMPPGVSLTNDNSAATGLPSQKKRLPSAHRYQELREPKAVDKVLETLFASNRGPEQPLERTRYSRTLGTHPQPVKSIESERLATKRSMEDRFWELRNKLRRGTAPLQEIWKDCESLLRKTTWFRKNYGHHKMFSDGSTMVVPSSIVFLHVLLAVCQKERLVIDGQDFTPAHAIRIYMTHGVMKSWWSRVLWCQLGQVLQSRNRPTDETVGAALDEIILGNILEVWNVYEENYGFRSGHFIGHPARGSDEVDDKASTSEGFPSILANQHQIKPSDETAVAAAMTIECLRVAGIRVPSRVMGLFNRFGQNVKRDRSIAIRCLLRAGVPSEIIGEALEGWDSGTSLEPQKILLPTEKSDKTRVLTHAVNRYLKRHIQDWSRLGIRERLLSISMAAQRSDPRHAINLWHQFQAHIEASKSEAEKDSSDQVYVRFLRTFWALRRHDHAIEVWNHMIALGYPPMPKHWTAMLTGCIVARDVESLQRIWTNMLKSGMLPDSTTWTTYIHGLIDGRKWEEGLQALEQLGRIWKSAPPLKPSDTTGEKTTGSNNADDNQRDEEPKDESVLRPLENPVCAALSGLIHIDKRALIPRVLAWARAHQVPLSNYTYNILLKPIVRHESQAAIQAHLQQMAEANCTPDVVTFTIILNGLVSNPTSTFHTLPPEAQENTVTSILADMERHGIKPTTYTYSTLLDGLLTPGSRELADNYTPNVQAARTVLAHMAQQNIYPSTYVYTILITHYFNHRPTPDLPAVSSLWSSIFHSGQVYTLDNIFFDRLIEGYADNNQIEDALKFLHVAPEYGNTPGWGALVRLLRALIRAKEWGLCEELVEDVEREEGPLRVGQGRGQGREKAEFWELVLLLKERGVVVVDGER